MGKDYYKILGKEKISMRPIDWKWQLNFSSGLTKSATDDDIKKAYRKL